MSILKDVFAELVSMFVADARLTIALLALVAATAALVKWTAMSPLASGGLLLLGAIVILIVSAVREAADRAAKRG